MALRPTRPQSRSEQLAERNDAQQDVFLREVDDALREDELRGFLTRFGKPLAGLIVVALVALAGWLWWTDSQKQAAAERSETFTMALDQLEKGRVDTAYKQLEPLAKDGKGGSQAAAAMLQAGIALEQGRKDEAVRGFAAIAANESAPKPFRDLARIREVGANFDAMKPEDVVSRLKDLAVPGSPWSASAGELVAMAHLRQNKPELAGPLFAAIAKDKEAPESLRSRARQMAGLLGVDAIDDVAKAAGVAPAGASGQPAAPAQN